MPTYEYRCKTCGHHLEVVQSFKDDPLTECPECQGQLKKVFSPIGISFKGSGFYRNDSRSGSGSSSSGGTGGTDATKSESSSGSSDSSSSPAKSDSGSSSSTPAATAT